MKTEQLYELYKKSSGINTDSRKSVKGEIFFALWGDNNNGNVFASDALEKGASWAVIDDPLYETERTILVDDCLLELQALALHHRREMNVPVLAITGTNGKTTTKELLAQVTSRKYKVHYTKGNLNNHIGVPLTILSAPKDTQLMIIEMGANHIGEIRTLCNIARPDYGIITNIGTAHIEGFGSAEGVLKAKSELYEYLRKANGIALFNEKNPVLRDKIIKITNRAVPFSHPAGYNLMLEQLPSDLNLRLNARYLHKNYSITTNLFGQYNFENVRAAIATGLFFGVEMKEIVEAVENYQPANNRSQIKITGSNTLICDSYNANPTSMLSALESFIGIKDEKKLIILGDMLELGEKSGEEHIKIINFLQLHKIGDAFLVGPIFGTFANNTHYNLFPDVTALGEFIKENPVKGKTVLIKGSRGIGLEKIYNLI